MFFRTTDVDSTSPCDYSSLIEQKSRCTLPCKAHLLKILKMDGQLLFQIAFFDALLNHLVYKRPNLRERHTDGVHPLIHLRALYAAQTPGVPLGQVVVQKGLQAVNGRRILGVRRLH